MATNISVKGGFEGGSVTFRDGKGQRAVAEQATMVKAEMNGLAPGLDQRRPFC